MKAPTRRKTSHVAADLRVHVFVTLWCGFAKRLNPGGLFVTYMAASHTTQNWLSAMPNACTGDVGALQSTKNREFDKRPNCNSTSPSAATPGGGRNTEAGDRDVARRCCLDVPKRPPLRLSASSASMWAAMLSRNLPARFFRRVRGCERPPAPFFLEVFGWRRSVCSPESSGSMSSERRSASPPCVSALFVVASGSVVAVEGVS